MTPEQSFKEVANAEEYAIVCRNEKCSREIVPLDRYFFDVLTGKAYCCQCGTCLRYARKKSVERGETMESAVL